MTKQNKRCEHCSHPFMPGDTVELHHRDGDRNNWNHVNLVALHRQCHQYQEVHKDRIKEGIAGSQTKAKKGHRKVNLGEPCERRYGTVLKRGALR